MKALSRMIGIGVVNEQHTNRTEELCDAAAGQNRLLAGGIRGPYFVLRDAGVELTLASPKGGQPPVDPKSDLPENQTPAMTRFKQDTKAQKELSQTVKLSDMKSEDFHIIFYVGGHER